MAAWREYHEQTKHTPDSVARNRRELDWANMPDPFRHYEGAPLIDLPAGPPVPESPEPVRDGAWFLSSLLFHSMAISAAKRTPSGTRYALRVNPSSGNLHPAEVHFVTRGVAGWPSGLYHYRPSCHMAEQRATGEFPVEGIDAPVILLITNIAWREAWKYQSRAYRYCCLDTGHAAESIALAAREMKCAVRTMAEFNDAGIVRQFRLHSDEWPMLLMSLSGSAIPCGAPEPAAGIHWTPGAANRLSPFEIADERIARIHEASAAPATAPLPEPPAPSTGISLPGAERPGRPFSAVVRGRRSALDFTGGSRMMRFSQLAALLGSIGPTTLTAVEIYLYAHRVDGLEPGVYRFAPGSPGLDTVRTGCQQVIAAGLSLGQPLAGNSCAAFSIIAHIGPDARHYRYAHFEAGAVGQRLYVTAEALGLRATGIGAFYDDEVHRYLGIDPLGDRQVVYHFSVGYPVRDLRLEA